MAMLGSPGLGPHAMGPQGVGQPSQVPPQSQGQAGVSPPSLYMLQWHEHHSSFFRLMEELCSSQSMTDVTVACGDVSLEAHSIILGASSPLLRSILAKGEGKKQTIHFMDMNPFHMQLLLQYMYRGEVSVPQSDLAPLMQSAKALRVGGLSGGNSDEKISEFATYLAQQQQYQQPLTLAQPQQQHIGPMQGQVVPGLNPELLVEGIKRESGTAAPKKQRRSRVPDEHAGDKFDLTDKSIGLDFESVSPDGQDYNPESKLMVKPRKISRQLKRRIETQHEHDDGTALRPEPSDNGEVGVVMDDDISGFEGEPFPSGSVTDNWSDQLTMKVRGHRIPVLPKPLNQMKTTETRSYLSRLIWATNGWKRPQYGNPETKPVWWPDELLKWSEMKKMGGKKADGLSNVNYNEIQKNILCEGYRFFGFDPETLCYVGSKEDKDKDDPPTTPINNGLVVPVVTPELFHQPQQILGIPQVPMTLSLQSLPVQSMNN